MIFHQDPSITGYDIESSIGRYAITALESTFYLFGGYNNGDPGPARTIAAFNTITKQWKIMGKLLQWRDWHGVIELKGEFIVVGGWGKFRTERCTFVTEELIKCSNTSPVLLDYTGWPEMMRVPYDYCPK